MHIIQSNHKLFRSRKASVSSYHSPEVVGRGSKTQIQVGEQLNDIT